jgi:hypothetical protein
MPERLILFRPRPEFALPPAWCERPWIPLGDLRPLLQAISPVRDLSDIWRWVAVPQPAQEVEAALAPLTGVVIHRGDRSTRAEDRQAREARVSALLVPAEPEESVERVELTDAAGSLLGSPEPETVRTMLEASAALRRACGCLAVGIG